MSIIAFVGLPGSGKSYGIVENVIVPALKELRPIYTNIPLRLDEIEKEFPGAPVTVIDDLALYTSGEKFFEFEKGAVIVLDEVWRLWRSGMRANNAPVKAIEFFAEHRHMVGENGKTTEIVLCCQDLGQVAAFTRQLVEKTFISRKLSAAGLNGHYRVDVYMGMVTGQKGPETRLTGVIRGKYKPEIYRFYKSHTKSEGDVAGVEQVADKRGVVWRHPLIRYGIPLALVAIAFGVWGISNYFGGMAERHGVKKVPPVEVSDGVAPVGSLAQVNARRLARGKGELSQQVVADGARQDVPAERESKRWRIVAAIRRDDTGQGVVVARDWDGNMRQFAWNQCEDVKGASLGKCRVDGEVITAFSGIRPALLPSIIQAPRK